MSRLTLKTRYRLGAAAILLVFSILLSVIAYSFLRHLVTTNAFKETELFVGTASAIRTYVKEVLRPKIYEHVDANTFFPEGMSTSFVSRNIMENLQDRFPHFHYKRVALWPRNPMNKADPDQRQAFFPVGDN